MPGEVIDRPNPGPAPSHLPDEVLQLAVKVNKDDFNPDRFDSLEAVKEFRQASNYIAAGKLATRFRSTCKG
jgi:xylulose-5-phosphate/fructose-6-phosphate phosphoketolase